MPRAIACAAVWVALAVVALFHVGQVVAVCWAIELVWSWL
jgi:hypothetical protein